MTKEYPVYNLDQTTGIKSSKFSEQGDLWNSIDKAKSIIDAIKNKPAIQNHSTSAYYNPSEDVIVIPELNQFVINEEYYSTLFHEIVHSTGHPKRLNRSLFLKAIKFGDEEYAKEELVAEMGAIFLCSNCDFFYSSRMKNSAAYIQSWMSGLKNDPALLIVAASQAQKAIDFILNKKFKIDEVERKENENLGEYKFEKNVMWVN